MDTVVILWLFAVLWSK